MKRPPFAASQIGNGFDEAQYSKVLTHGGSPAPKFGGRLIEAVGPGHEVVDTARRQQVPVGVGSTDAQGFGSRHDATGSQFGSSLLIRSQTDLRGASNGRDGRLTLIQAVGLTEIGDA